MTKRRWLIRRRAGVAALVGAMLISGCTRTVTHRVARYEPAGQTPQTAQTVPRAAWWKVKVRGHDEKDYHGIDGTERYLQEGDVVGFRAGEDDVVYAVVNREQIALSLTGEHRRVVWHASREKTTGFGRAMETTARVLISAAVVGAVGVVLLYAITHPAEDECESGWSH